MCTNIVLASGASIALLAGILLITPAQARIHHRPTATPTLVVRTPTPSVLPLSDDPSGELMPQAAPGWHTVFADNFAGENVPLGAFSGCAQNGSVLTSHCTGLPAAVDARWWAYPDGWAGTPNTSTYAPSKSLSIHDGVMDLYLHTEGGVHMIDAPVPKDTTATGPWGGRVYGKYIVRMKLDSATGYHVSFLLWPDSNVWPRDGEIDWPEADLDQSITGAFVHWQNATSGGQQDSYIASSAVSSGWHTYETDWSASAITFLLDGRVIGQSTDPYNIPNTPMHWVLQTGQSFTEPLSGTAVSHVLVDWAVEQSPQ